ncbi:MAG: hypothetical protein QGG40_00475 [Myxococcota bacterium]|jgi:hypothetical protein|nr:hypothetical protein [Myxococcota bacterium]
MDRIHQLAPDRSLFVTIERRDLLMMKVADGLANDAEIEELNALGDAEISGDLEALRQLGSEIRRTLRAPDTPSLVNTVLSELQLTDGWSRWAGQLERESREVGRMSLVEEVLTETHPDADSVTAGIADALREDAGAPPSLWSAISADLDLPSGGIQQGDLHEAILGESGTPSLADAVMQAIIDESSTDLHPSGTEIGGNVIALPRASKRVDSRGQASAENEPAEVIPISLGSRLRLPVMGMAAAACLLFSFFPTAPGAGTDALVLDIAPANHVEIEDLYTEGDVFVQVMQFDHDSPTIIFIDEIPADDSSGAGEVTPL